MWNNCLGKTAFNAGILNIWCYYVDITIHLAMIAMLLDFTSSVYGLAGAYFEFWYWAGFWAGLIGHWGRVLSHRPGNPVWQTCLVQLEPRWLRESLWSTRKVKSNPLFGNTLVSRSLTRNNKYCARFVTGWCLHHKAIWPICLIISKASTKWSMTKQYRNKKQRKVKPPRLLPPQHSHWITALFIMQPPTHPALKNIKK